MKNLKDNIYYVGILNPNLRVFDIIMKTEYGTSYNAYIVKGEKTALIETAHDRFTDDFFDNIKEVCPLESIDYIVMNHTEPDHSGSIAALLGINPDIKIIASAAGIKNIRNITNMDFNAVEVKNGDTLDLGGTILEFIIAPNLHWPDSMFTYIRSSKVLFSCDFLGAHYCEMNITDDRINYPKAYADAFRYYYDAIFGPFGKFVNAGLDKIKDLEIDMVCNSHGPVLKKGIANAMACYREWAKAEPQGEKAAIFYVSAYGYTRTLAEAAKKALDEKGIETSIFDIIEHDSAEMLSAFGSAKYVLIGSPTINRDALKPVWDLLSSVDAVNARGKKCFIFGSYGWSGEAAAMLEARVKSIGMQPIESLRVVMKPSESDLEAVNAKISELIS